MLQQCKSKCSGVTRPYCSIGVNDLADFECFECGSEFNKSAIFKNLQTKHGMNWGRELVRLNELKKEVRFMSKKLRAMGFTMAEAVYLDSDFNHVEHSQCLEKEKLRTTPDKSKINSVLIPKLSHHLK